MRTVVVLFGDHVSASSLASMRAGLNAYGVVTENASQEFSVEVFREPKLPGLLEMLVQWERHGFLTYSLR